MVEKSKEEQDFVDRIQVRLHKIAEDEAMYSPTVDDIPAAIMLEVERAKRRGEKFASLHEAYAVILEEVDEVWDITRQKKCERAAWELRKEFIQIGAMAVKALQSLDNFVGGKV